MGCLGFELLPTGGDQNLGIGIREVETRCKRETWAAIKLMLMQKRSCRESHGRNKP
jgi:hypothetical protein